MSNEHNFLITYGLHNFVTHAQIEVQINVETSEGA